MIEQFDNYVILDVETACQSWGSICAIGAVFVENGEIVEEYHQYINPLCEFSPLNVRIHGITPERVENAPTFAQQWEHFYPKIEGKMLVAYNASFDINALLRAIRAAHLPEIEPSYICALQLTKKLAMLPSYKLTDVAAKYGIAYHAHNALEDVKATHQVLRALMAEQNVSTLMQLAQLADLTAERTQQMDSPQKSGNGRSLSSCERGINPLEHGTSTFFQGKNVVFSGNLRCAPRKRAQDAVAAMGGMCKNNVSKKTDIVIIGEYDLGVLSTGCTISTKHQAALDLQAAGIPIQIIHEDEFVQTLQEGL